MFFLFVYNFALHIDKKKLWKAFLQLYCFLPAPCAHFLSIFYVEQKRVVHFHDHLPIGSWRQFGGIGVKCQIRLRVILNILKSIDDKPLRPELGNHLTVPSLVGETGQIVDW